ncbi:Hypothetical predicted protein [Prunus dulcis]|uniref:Uncharacterized protein n=2 Tax=Prunus dulcis TaxID=3755 RepID=A0A5E4FBH6_PRUDU|nr:uncharacterized protein LOC117619180 [Prunus dulcis]VVA24419.1 Hypothetical predicted protein [Prunus dulcis]
MPPQTRRRLAQSVKTGRKMGRRAASRNEEMAHMPQGTNPSSERVEPRPEAPRLEMIEQTNSKLPEAPRLEMIQQTNSKLPIEEQGTNTSRKRPKRSDAVVRRSLRIQDSIVPTQNQNMEHVIEDTTVSEGENEDEQPAHKMHGSTSGEKSLEEKVNYLVQLLDTMNLKARNKNSDFCESPASMYKSLYADSQKIKALETENHQLSLKLEVALAKLEAYENGTRAFSEMADKLKDLILVSNLAKATETAVNLSSQTARGACSRKKKTALGVVDPQEDVLSHLINPKGPTVEGPKTAAKRKK